MSYKAEALEDVMTEEAEALEKTDFNQCDIIIKMVLKLEINMFSPLNFTIIYYTFRIME